LNVTLSAPAAADTLNVTVHQLLLHAATEPRVDR
jgi:hypothetical protein